ncbi:MAG: AMP-binding protein [Caldilineaceae bacterium]|nr:AMP-binding protein [Caldilineaceae bacterium]
MIEAAFAQLRLAASLALGLPFSPRSLDRIIDNLQATRREFGGIDRSGAELVQGPPLDPAAMRAVHLRRFRAQARRASRETAYYAELFARLALDPTRLRWEDLGRIPPTPKAALRARPDDFVCRDAQATLNCTTTGTTGRPTNVCFSNYEMQTYIAFSTIGHLVAGTLSEADILHIATSSRAMLSNICAIGAAQRVSTLVLTGGLIEPAQTLALLAQERSISGKHERTSVLLSYPSYLGELVETGLRLGYRPTDFGLKRIFVGSEMVTAGLMARSQALFGALTFSEGYGMTETWPCNGTVCEQGHLHFEPSSALIEVCDLETDAVAPPGALGRLIVTPLPPYRDTTLLLRYDTEDLVQTLAEPPTCALRNLPAVTRMLGKRRLSVAVEGGWVYPRQVLEALEALDCVPLPARCGFWAVAGGVAVEVVARDTEPATRRQIENALEEQGVPLRELHVYSDRSQLRQPIPLRCDLKELSFGDAASPPPPLDVWSFLSSRQREFTQNAFISSF